MRGEDPLIIKPGEEHGGAPPRAWGGRRIGVSRIRCCRSTPTCVGRTRVCRAPPGSTSEHPHVRGEDGTTGPGREITTGAPPRAWGGRLCWWGASGSRSEHPHVRGEDPTGVWCRARFDGAPPRAWRTIEIAQTEGPDDGAPPRAWGGRGGCRRWRGWRRSTPTCVGRTPAVGPAVGQPTEHPHVRGEDGSGAGSVAALPRSTPTCVGRTRRRAWACGRWAEHPHVRGEDAVSSCHYSPHRGAPPRAWGGPGGEPGRVGGGRSTPTCVGRTRSPAAITAPIAEHPHVRGEDTARGGGAANLVGAPPRAWGGPMPPLHLTHRLRSTPTCVGRTLGDASLNTAVPEHPHVRGEDTTYAPRTESFAGAPPRAWGGRRIDRSRSNVDRSTPTCVGRTVRPAHLAPGRGEHPHVRGEDTGRLIHRGRGPGAPPRAWGGRCGR